MNIVSVKSGEPYDIYCGRTNKYYGLPQSKWANPFVIGRDGTRAEVILKFRLAINSDPDLLADLPELRNKTLGCWCDYPNEDCHCRVLLELAESKFIKNWFSNMLPFDEPFISSRGVAFLTPENLYQAMKMSPDREDLRRKIAAMPPHKAKVAIRDKDKFPWRSNWTKQMALQGMRIALDHKFKKGTSWHQKLMMTEDWEIVEWNNWGDTYWGKDIKTREGENHLGKILMEIRKASYGK